MTFTGRWMAIALFVSLAANLFLGGMLFGDRFRHRGPPPGMEAGGPPAEGGAARNAIQRLIRSLPPDQRPAFEAQIAQRRQDFTAAQQELRAARLNVRDKIVVEPFDKAGVDAAFESVRQRSSAIQKLIHDAVVAGAANLPIEARRAMVAAFAEGGPRGRGPGGGPPGTTRP